jgi:hypothetical protein
MKMRQFLSIIAVLILAIAGIILPASPVLAIGTINTVSPDNGPVGATVNVSGSGFTASGNCYIFFDTTAFGPFPASVGGTLSANIQVPKVARTGSSYQIHVRDDFTGTDSNYIYFKITPQIAIGATTASVGDSVTVYGNGFFASSSVAIYFDNAIVGTVNTDSSGAFDGASFLVPPAYRGTHAVKCKDTSDYTPPINLSIISKLTASPSSGGTGDKITLTGSGFAAGSALSFYWDDSVITGDSVTSDLNGGFTVPGFTVPTSAKGTHNIKAQDVNSNSANATFSTAQKISVSPASGVSGTQVTVKGNGFDAGKSVSIKYNSATIAPTTGAVVSDSSGGFSTTFPIPAGATGNYTIDAYDGLNLAQATFSQFAEIKINLETSAAKPGYVGQGITLTGEGLRPNVTVNIYFASDTTLIGTATTDGNGHFSTTIKIPASAPGDHIITVTDSLTIKSFPFYMESQAPALPKLLTPKDKDKLDDPGSFTWDTVTDPSGVTYTLQVTTDKNFAGVVIEKKLAQPSYTLSAQEKLPSNNSNNPYYWRVKATDGTGLDSGWTTVQTFNVGYVFELTAWMIGIIIGIGGILLFLMGFLLGRKVALQ